MVKHGININLISDIIDDLIEKEFGEEEEKRMIMLAKN